MKKPESKFNLGDKVKGKITRYEGTIVTILFFLNGSISYEVQAPELVNGAVVASECAPEYYWEKVENGEATWEEIKAILRKDFGTLKSFSMKKEQIQKQWAQRKKEIAKEKGL